MTPRLALLVLPALGAMTLTGCGFKGAQDFPLPGGVATGDDAFEITAEFTDVLDLVPQSSVKVNDVTVGSVSDIELKEDNRTAVVTVRVRKDVTLPGNTTASIRQTALLGEKFVSLDPPATGAVGQLKGGETITKTERSFEIEEVLSALSLLLNGGGLEQIQTISDEVTNALKGREPQVKDLLTQLDTFVGGLDDQKQDIVRALDSLDRLTARLSAQRTIISTALDDLPDGARVLADQRADLTRLVQGLDRLSDVSVRVINASQENAVADLKALQPILAGLNDAGDSLPRSLELLTTYPFPREVSSGIRGDYANLFISLDLGSVLRNPLPALPGPLGSLPLPPLPPLNPAAGTTATPQKPAATTPAPALPGLPAIPGLTGTPGATTAAEPDPGLTSLTQLLLGGLVRSGAVE